VCVCGGFGRPGRAGLSRDSGELRERPGRRRTGRGTGPNPYAKAADPEQPKRKQMGSRKRVDVGGEMLDARGDVVKGAERLDVAVPIRLVDLRDRTLDLRRRPHLLTSPHYLAFHSGGSQARLPELASRLVS
jgi:hypothetical protein